MASSDTALYLDRRSTSRVLYRSSVQLVSDLSRPLHLHQALSQDLSVSGLQVLTPVILERYRQFPIWIPLWKGMDEGGVAEAQAKVAWFAIEDTLGDSPFWIRAGLRLTFSKENDRDLFFGTLSQRLSADQSIGESLNSKVGFIF